MNGLSLPILRKTMPNLIAASLVNVQPMSGPIGSIFKFTTFNESLYENTCVPFGPELYKTFLRLNNRRKTQCIHNLRIAGYPIIFCKLRSNARLDSMEWCDNQFGKYGYFKIDRFFAFRTIEDSILYKLTWSEYDI